MSNICICGHQWKDHIEATGKFCIKHGCDCSIFEEAVEVGKSRSVSNEFAIKGDPVRWMPIASSIMANLICELLEEGVITESIRFKIHTGFDGDMYIIEAYGLRRKDEKAK